MLGDELQGIKKGVLELADAIAVNKADGDGAMRAQVALGEVSAALRYLPSKGPRWKARAVAVSGLTGQGLDELWAIVEEHRAALEASGDLLALRAEQQRAWMWSLIGERLERAFRGSARVAPILAAMEADVVAGRITPPVAVDAALAGVHRSPGPAMNRDWDRAQLAGS